MGNRLMLYPNVLQLLTRRHGVPLERAHKLWDEAAEHATGPVGPTPEDTADWESVMSSFLRVLRCKARNRR